MRAAAEMVGALGTEITRHRKAVSSKKSKPCTATSIDAQDPATKHAHAKRTCVAGGGYDVVGHGTAATS